MSAPAPTPTPVTPAGASPVRTRVGAIAAVLACGALSAWLCTRAGPGADTVSGIGAWVRGWITGGSAGLLWCAAAVGLGALALRALAPTCRGLERFALAAALGVGLMVWIDHLLGVAGAFRAGFVGPFGGWALTLLGALALWRCRADFMGEAAVQPATLAGRIAVFACLVPLGVLVVAVCVPPGTLWQSEANGYDALSYHLALPMEWWGGRGPGAGALRPLEHNVYSFLPSYVEASYLRLGAMLGGPGIDGRWITACSALHAGTALLAALAGAGFASGLARRLGAGSPALAAAFAGAAVMVTPWTVVTGSLAYNEMAMVLTLIGACHLALEGAAGPDRAARVLLRGVALGAVLGAAVGCKPTAAFMGGPVVAMALLAWNPRGAWARLIAGACIGGLMTSLPWLVRNWAACRNPVFPSLSGVFGPAHWDAGQHARWHAAHHSDLPILDRLARLFSTDFGVTHPQWGGGAVWLLFATAALVCVLHPALRRAGLPLVLGLVAQVLAWMFIGHQQARFLMPCLVTGAALVGVAGAGIGAGGRARLAHAVMLALLLSSSLSTLRGFVRENGGAPARALAGGVPAITGAFFAPLDRVQAGTLSVGLERGAFLRALAESGNPVAASNLALPLLHAEAAASAPGAPAEPVLLYLLGDATPVYFAVPTLWNTVWDRWPLESARLEHPEQPVRWGASLRACGVTHVLVNFNELARFRASGYSPEAMTPEAAAAFVRAGAEPVFEWPERGVGLYRLTPPAP